MVPNGVRAQGTVKLLNCLLLRCRCQDLPPALSPQSLSLPPALLPQTDLLFWAILIDYRWLCCCYCIG